MSKSAQISRLGLIVALTGLVLALCAPGCGSDRLKREVEEKNKTIAELDELKKKAEADLAAKDTELRTVVEKLQKQNADTKRQLDSCGATLAELREKVRTQSKPAAKSPAKKPAAPAKAAPAKKPAGTKSPPQKTTGR